MAKRTARRREYRAASAKSHFAQLIGLEIYFFIAASTCGAAVFGMMFAVDWVFQVNISPAHVAAVAVFFIVLYALHKSYAEPLRQNIDNLRRCAPAQHFIENKLAYAFLAVALTAMPTTSFLVLRHSLEPRSPLERAPTERHNTIRPAPDVGKPAERARSEVGHPAPRSTPNTAPPVQTEPQLASEEFPSSDSNVRRVELGKSVEPAPSSHPSKHICALDEPFSEEELEACLKHLHKHPPRTGLGGR
jgi:hypothetical protein